MHTRLSAVWLAACAMSAPLCAAEPAEDTAAATLPAAEQPAAALSPSGTAPAAAVTAPDSGMDFNALDARVQGALLFGGSSPVSFSGEARLKIQEHFLTDRPSFMATDQSWTAAGYEGNESMLRVGMVVRPNRNAVLWSKIGFQNTLPGNFLNVGPGNDGYTRAQERHDKTETSANIHEDMAAGLAIRTVPASAWLRMGNVIWTEASPLTIWKAQPRTFAWEYLPYEVEQPVSRYYEYNLARGEKTGRAAWNKKPFNGLELRSIHLPGNLQFGLLYGTFERFDNFEREYIDFSGDLAYSGDNTEAKGRGIGDSHRHLFHARVAIEKLFNSLTLGYNAMVLDYKPDVALTTGFRNIFGFNSVRAARDSSGALFQYYLGGGFVKEPQVHSLDLRGNIGESFEIHSDVALGFLDTTYHRFGVDSAFKDENDPTTKYYTAFHRTETKRTDYVPALFTKLRYKAPISVQADMAWIPKGFYSPFSFAAPADAFYPFGANMVGGGKFVARGEGSPYIQNMGGMQLSLHANPGYGHFRVAYGQHFQLEKARDLIFFPYRLNGQDMSSFFQSSYNRWGNHLIDHSLDAKYRKRIGDETYRTTEYLNPLGPDAGGMRTDYLSTYEGFVPYENAAQAEAAVTNPATTSIYTRSPNIPEHRKWTFNLELDASKDVGPLVGYGRELFLGGYAALNGVSQDFRALAFSDDDMMLWGAYVRIEPAIAITEKLYLLALGGFETWRAEKAYMDDPVTQVVGLVPLEYNDYAAGIGFDWEFGARIGLHARYKWFKHVDENFTDNNWTGRIMSAEIKTWF